MNPDIWLVVTVICMVCGFGGVFLPALPGVPAMWVVALIYAIITKFERLTGLELGWLALIAVASVVVDILSGLVGSKLAGAGKQSIIWGVVGMLAGTIIAPPFGGFFGLALAVFIVERVVIGRKSEAATKAAIGSVVGTAAGMGLNTILGVVLIALTIAWGR